MLNETNPTRNRPNVYRFTTLVAMLASPLVAALACSGMDLTEIGTDLEAVDTETEPAGPDVSDTETNELERLRAENEKFVRERISTGPARRAALTDEERALLEAAPKPPSSEDLLAEWQELENAPLSAEDEYAVRALFEARGQLSTELRFRGRTVSDGDMVYTVDELLSEEPASDASDKAQLPTGSNQIPRPLASDPPLRPNTFAQVTNGTFGFRRPETNRLYYMVVPDAVVNANPWVFDALLQATNDIHSALSDDCLNGILVPIRTSNYNQLDEFDRQLASLITVDYAPFICATTNPPGGCASFPRVGEMVLGPGLFASRMRLGIFLRLDSAGPVTSTNARNIVLHELTHVLGFVHPEYPELDPTLITITPRIPTTSQGTLPTAMAPTESSLFSSQVSADDKQALRKTYSGQCAFSNNFRSLGQMCSTANDQNCQRHGGACEVDSGGVEQCRWHHFSTQQTCGKYSFGDWQTANPQPGTAGSCIMPAASIPSYTNPANCFGHTHTQPFDGAGRCCTQGDRPGVLFKAFSSAHATTFICSDQLDLWDLSDWDANWEFVSASEANDFTPVDPATLAPANGWQLTGGEYRQTLNRTDSMVVGDEDLRYGCVSTLVTTSDDDESGIVFDYQNSQNYYVFDLTPSVRRRIRRVQNGVSTNLSSVPINIQTPWSPGIALKVCFVDGEIHTFINDTNRVSIAAPFPSNRTGNRYSGLWNSWNASARYAYLRSFPAVQGFATVF